MSRSTNAIRFEPRTRAVGTIRDKRDRLREQEDQEDINEVFAKESRDHAEQISMRS